MDKDLFNSQIEKLDQLVNRLIAEERVPGKIAILESTEEFQAYIRPASLMQEIYYKGEEDAKLVIASIAVLEQAEIVFRGLNASLLPKLSHLIEDLLKIEVFYREMGGIVGYHAIVLRLLQESQDFASQAKENEHYLKPSGYDLEGDSQTVDQYIRWGIEHLPLIGEIYPVGGAGDRLSLKDEETGEDLPAAQLLFLGRPLLTGMVRDAQAKEYLYYKLIGKQIITPIAMMTSHEKNNYRHILEICEKNQWFGRQKTHFFLFVQPLVPVITIDGHWSMKGALKPSLKPGGHGVLWKLARDKGALQWLSHKKREFVLVRQINNPVAGTDHGVLAFTGIGAHYRKKFGFASCPRLLNTSEGMDVLLEGQKNGKYEYSISNVEYTNFTQKGIKDAPEKKGSPYSCFPANTNILFADLREIEKILHQCPVPGVIVNFKKTAPYIDREGNEKRVKAGRLESTMQNISDYIIDAFEKPIRPEDHFNLKSYLTYNDRRKTISVTKHSYEPSKPIIETPEGAFYEVMQNNRELFLSHCCFHIPELCCEEEYLKQGPNILIQYHPALGPLYLIIGQKIRKGKIVDGSELQLEIAELSIENLDLQGSLLIIADEPLGKKDAHGNLQYGESSGKCRLKNVTIVNKGIDREADNVYWKNRIARNERLEIRLQGTAEFVAEDMTIEGDLLIEVPDGWRYTALQKSGKVEFIKEEIAAPTWFWKYSFDSANHINLSTESFTQ